MAPVTAPRSSSISGNSPVCTASRATSMLSAPSCPQPSGQGEWISRKVGPSISIARRTFWRMSQG
jgi:hypothetical protein